MKNAVFSTLLLIIIFFVALAYFSFNASTPWYIAPDQDSALVIDSILIHNGLHPDHIVAPGFGLYFLQYFSQKAGYLLGSLDAISLRGLMASLNPIFPLVDLTNYIRRHTPVLILSITVLLSFSFFLVYGLNLPTALLVLLFLLAQRSFVFHSAIIRVEMYGLFYWALSVFTASLAYKSKSTLSRFGLLAASGFCLGLSLLSKIQMVFFIATAFLFVFYLVFQLEKFQTFKRAGWQITIGLFNFTLYTYLFIASYTEKIPEGMGTWAQDYGTSFASMMFFAVLLYIVIFFSLPHFSERFFFLSKYVAALNATLTGFVVSFFTPLLLYSSCAKGLTLALYNFKVLFFRKSFHSTDVLSNYMIDDTFQQLILKLQECGLILVGGLIAILLFFYFHQKRKINYFWNVTLFFLAFGILVCGNLVFATRFLFRDLLLIEFLFCFFICILFCHVSSQRDYGKMGAYRIFVVFMAALIIFNLFQFPGMKERTLAHFSAFGFQQNSWMEKRYNRNHVVFEKLMNRFYNESMKKNAMDVARNYDSLKRTIRYIFSGRHMSMQYAGIVEKGFPCQQSNLNYRIKTFPSQLKKSILVDPKGLGERVGFLINYRPVADRKTAELRPSEFISHDRQQRDYLSLLPRNDLEIYIFTDESDDHAVRALTYAFERTAFRITVQHQYRKKSYTGFRVPLYLPIGRDIFKKHYFVVFKHHHRPFSF